MKRKWTLGLWPAVLIAVLVACASPPQPFDYHDDRDEKQGPGLFSGDTGGMVIYGDSAEKNAAAEKAPED